jgi:hypothetical protein
MKGSPFPTSEKFMLRYAALLAIAVLPAAVIAAEEKKGAPTELRGSVTDAGLMKEAPANGIVTSAKDFEKLCKAWKVEAPKVDFKKNFVIVGTTIGSRLFGRPMLQDGDLKVSFASTSDLGGEGFRYVMLVYPREGVKTVNGKELPAD